MVVTGKGRRWTVVEKRERDREVGVGRGEI